MKRLLLILTIMTAVLGFAVAAHAEVAATDTFLVTATVVATCEVDVEDINFGEYGGVPVTGTGGIKVRCVEGLDFLVALGKGESVDIGRQMTGGDDTGIDTLTYEIFTDTGADPSDTWGDKCLAGATYGSYDCIPGSGAGSLTDVPFTMHGYIGADLEAELGSYTDTVAISIWY